MASSLLILVLAHVTTGAQGGLSVGVVGEPLGVGGVGVPPFAALKRAANDCDSAIRRGLEFQLQPTVGSMFLDESSVVETVVQFLETVIRLEAPPHKLFRDPLVGSPLWEEHKAAGLDRWWRVDVHHLVSAHAIVDVAEKCSRHPSLARLLHSVSPELTSAATRTTGSDDDDDTRTSSPPFSSSQPTSRLPPNDPFFNEDSTRRLNPMGQRAHLEACQVVSAWELHRGDPSVVVQVVDSGMDLDHQDLQLNTWYVLEE